MARKPKFDPALSITNELIAIIERGVLPWRRPWKVPGARLPLRHTGEPYQGINNFLLTLRTNLAGYGSPYWMTMHQANELGARIRKGQTSSVVVYYGTSYKEEEADQTKDQSEDSRTAIPFLKSYRVFNADQIDGLPDTFHPKAEAKETVPAHEIETIPHMQDFFDAIGANVLIAGREASYVPALDQINIPPMEVFQDAESYFDVLGHEHIHWTKAPNRLNRKFGSARFGNTAYAREEIVAQLGSVFLGQHLGYAPQQMELSASYIEGWLTVLRSDKRAIFKHSADAMRACQFLIEAAEKGVQDVAA